MIDERQVTPKMREAYQAMMALSPEQRGRIICWFCHDCYAYIGPGKNWTCGMHEKDVEP
jgi:hypothetical protein